MDLFKLSNLLRYTTTALVMLSLRERSTIFIAVIPARPDTRALAVRLFRPQRDRPSDDIDPCAASVAVSDSTTAISRWFPDRSSEKTRSLDRPTFRNRCDHVSGAMLTPTSDSECRFRCGSEHATVSCARPTRMY